jgi:predicted lactoylglutathione lyase
MPNKQIYISFPVSDVNSSTEFYKKLGFTKQEDWSMEGRVSCMMWSENIYIMLTAKDLYKTYINNKEIIDARNSSHSLISLTLNSKEEVDVVVKIANENGGSHYVYNSGMDFMYNMMVEDLDGNTIEFVYMDMSKMTQ